MIVPFIFFVGYVVWGMLFSVQPPFYPGEAEKKGATPAQVGKHKTFSHKIVQKNVISLILKYGFVFGIAHMAAMLAAPVFAVFAGRIGPKKVYLTGRKAFLKEKLPELPIK